MLFLKLTLRVVQSWSEQAEVSSGEAIPAELTPAGQHQSPPMHTSHQAERTQNQKDLNHKVHQNMQCLGSLEND